VHGRGLCDRGVAGFADLRPGLILRSFSSSPVRHSSSAIVYPLFFWLRWPDALARQAFLRFWLIGVMSALVALGCLALASTQGYEIAWFGQGKLSDQTYMRHMRTHHEQGIELASIAATSSREKSL
jgi:hypothetical protein